VDIAPGLDHVINVNGMGGVTGTSAVSISPSADVLIDVVAIDCIVDVCGMSNSIGS